MCHFCPQLGSEKTHHADPNKGINMNIANGIWHGDLCLFTEPDKPQRTCDCNWQSTSCRGRYCLLHYDPAAIQKWDGQTSPANPKDGRCHTDSTTCSNLYRGRRQFLIRINLNMRPPEHSKCHPDRKEANQ